MNDSVDYIRPIPENFDEPPFPESIESIYSNKNTYMTYYHYHIAHRNTYFRYADMQENTRNLLQLLKDEGYE